MSHGTIAARYGLDLLVDAIARVPDAELEILGDGELRPALELQVSRLGLGDRVRIAGFVPIDEIADRLARADVGVVANRSDAFTELVLPTKLLEYAALGIPAVAPRTLAVTTYLGDDLLALFRPGDVDDLADAIRRVRDDPAGAERRADRAVRALSERYGWPAMARRYVQLIESVAGHPRSAAHDADDGGSPK